MYPLGNYMNKKNVFFAFLWLFLCLHAMYLEKNASWFTTRGICRLSGADHVVRDMNENSWCVHPLGDKAIRVVHSNMLYHWIGNWMNADSSGVNAVVIYKHLWSLERILVGDSQKNFKLQNALKCLKYPPSEWSSIRTLSNEVWG